jgi:hypothetical protein
MVASTGRNSTVSGRNANIVRQSPNADSHRRVRHPSQSQKTNARILKASRLTNDPFAHRSSSSTLCSAVSTRAFSKSLSTSSTATISSNRKSIHHAHRQVYSQAQCAPQPGARGGSSRVFNRSSCFVHSPPHTHVYLRTSLEKTFHTNFVLKYMSVAIYRVSI